MRLSRVHRHACGSASCLLLPVTGRESRGEFSRHNVGSLASARSTNCQLVGHQSNWLARGTCFNVADDGLGARLDVNVFDRHLLLTLTAQSVESLQLLGE